MTDGTDDNRSVLVAAPGVAPSRQRDTALTGEGASAARRFISAIKGIRFAVEAEQTFYPLETHPANPLEAPTGIEPVYTALQAAA